MKLSAFNIRNRKTQYFLTTTRKINRSLDSIQDILIDHHASLVSTLPESKLVIKFIKARSWHEYLKLLWNHSRVSKEVKGNMIIKGLGLRVPVIHEIGYGIIPSTTYKYIGYYVMENLVDSGFQELSKILNDVTTESALRKKIISAIFDGLKSMRDNRIIFSDFHFENIFSDSKGEVIWIDTGVTTYSKLNNRKFVKKFNQSVSRYSLGNRLLDEEVLMFNTLIIETNNLGNRT